MIVLKIRPVFPISFCHHGTSSSSVPLQYFQILFYNIPDILRTLEHEIVDNVEKVRRVSMDALIIIHHELVIDEPGTEIAKPVSPMIRYSPCTSPPGSSSSYTGVTPSPLMISSK